MDKNWLIRTKSNHILGPVSKEKVTELFQNGSLKANDEICTGNGFWFYIREEDMIERFLLGNEKQSFNPLSEAKDVLTCETPANEVVAQTPADMTMVGGFNISSLNESENEESSSSLQARDESISADVPEKKSEKKHSLDEEKKKNNKLRTVKKIKTKATVPSTKHTYLKYVFVLSILLLLALTYYRKFVIKFLFDGEMTRISLISPVYAQGELSEIKKKSFIADDVFIEGIRFKPEIGLNGFNVISQIDIATVKCEDLKKDILKLAFLLLPTDRFNEKILIKIRECVSKDKGQEVLNQWLTTIDQKRALSKSEQENKKLITEVLNSPYNLITDHHLKSKLSSILIEMPEDTLGETLLKSWLFLMLGNITRSDNLLKDFINTAPYYNWKKRTVSHSFYHNLSVEFIDNILDKIAKHPSDRLIFNLFSEYLLSYYADESLFYKLRNLDSGLDAEKIKLEYVKRIAPALVNHLRLKSLSDMRKVMLLKDSKLISLEEQSLWHWPFLKLDGHMTEAVYPTLKKWEETDQLWFIYLMHSERILDVWSKGSGKSFIHGRRQFLRQHLVGADFMLSLYKLIKFGDIDSTLVDHLGETQEK